MNSQDFLTINMVGAGAFLIWYLISRGGPTQPSRLNLKAPDTAPTVLEPVISEIPHLHDAPPSMKALNVMFVYNGHTWDAHEVLGIPAGASIPLVTEAYQMALKRCTGPESIEFLETAYRAILNKSS